jgi:hypothetical protein
MLTGEIISQLLHLQLNDSVTRTAGRRDGVRLS